MEQSFKELFARSGEPGACFGVCRHLWFAGSGIDGTVYAPMVYVADKVVESEPLHIVQIGGDALFKELEDLFFSFVPAVDGVTPELTVFTEGIGWHARDSLAQATLIQIKEFRMRPKLCAVVG